MLTWSRGLPIAVPPKAQDARKSGEGQLDITYTDPSLGLRTG
jgi:hypothetical protein